MLSRCILLPQYKNSLSKAQPLFSVAAYFQKVVDIHSFVGIITQQLKAKNCLRSEKRAAFLFRQQHHYFFSSIFADGKRTVNLFPIKPQRVPRMRRVLLSSIHPCILLNASFLQSKKHRYCVEPPPSVAVLRAMYRIRHLKPYHFLYALRLH